LGLSWNINILLTRGSIRGFEMFLKYMKKNQSPGVYDLQLDEPLNEASFVV